MDNIFCKSRVFRVALKCSPCRGCCKKNKLSAEWVRWRDLHARGTVRTHSYSSWIWVQLPGCFTLALPGLRFSHGRALSLTLGLNDSAFCIGSDREKLCGVTAYNILISALFLSYQLRRQMNKIDSTEAPFDNFTVAAGEKCSLASMAEQSHFLS